MTDRDDELDDFLRRSKPIFRRADEDDLEPPAELDRIVLRQAREAIEAERPQRVFRGPRWGAPIALAATLLIALTVVFQGWMPEKEPVGEVTVRSVAREVPAPAADAPVAGAPVAEAEAFANARPAQPAPAAAPPREEAADAGPYVVGIVPPQAAAPASSPALVSDAEASRHVAPPPAPPGVEMASAPTMARGTVQTAKARADAEVPPWRKDATTWLLEIQRLRAAGETGLADAEMAEYNRQHRAYAGAPDR